MQPEAFVWQPRGRATVSDPDMPGLKGWAFTFQSDADEIVLPLPAATFSGVPITLKFKFQPLSQVMGTVVAGIRDSAKSVVKEPIGLNVAAHECETHTVAWPGGESPEIFFRRGSTNTVQLPWLAIDGGQQEVLREPVAKAKKVA